jgi:hypothetical protein
VALNLQMMIRIKMVEGSAVEGEIAVETSTLVHSINMMPVSMLAGQSQGASSAVALVQASLQLLV